jgi:hypothetical protein
MQAPKAIKLTLTYACAVTATYYSYLYTKDQIVGLPISNAQILVILEALAIFELSKFAISSFLNYLFPDDPKTLEHIIDKRTLGFFDRRIHVSFPNIPVIAEPDSSPDEDSVSKATSSAAERDAEILLHR